MKIQRWALLDLALLSLMILGSRLALLVHEGGGHALPALACGAEGVEMKLSPLGGGYVAWRASAITPGQLALIKLGGIALNLLSGALAWGAARRMSSRGLLHLSLLLFGVGSVGGAIAYLSNGLYYGSGDPTGLAPTTLDISALQPFWLLGPPLLAAVAWGAARHWSEVLSCHVVPKGGPGRIGWTLATLGLAGAAYGGLWFLLQDKKVEGSTRQWRVEQEVRKEVERRTPPSTPPEAPRPVVRAEEVEHRLPSPAGPLVLLSAGLLAGLAALWRPWGASGEGRPALWGVTATAVAAAATVALLKLFG